MRGALGGTSDTDTVDSLPRASPSQLKSRRYPKCQAQSYAPVVPATLKAEEEGSLEPLGSKAILGSTVRHISEEEKDRTHSAQPKDFPAGFL